MPEDPVVLLRRAAEQIAPPGNAFERTVRRRMRRSGIARITSAAIAAVVFAVALTAVVRAFSQSSRPVGRWPTVPAPQGSAPRGIGVVKMLRAFDAKEAVALTEHALIRTADGGHHWVLATPPGFTRFEASAMSYLDPRHGWIVAVPPAGNGSLSVFRTADGGKTWGRSSIRLGEGLDSLAAGPGQPEAPELGFADRLHGWIRLPVSPAPLLVTSDGGATWRAGPTLDSGDIVQAMTFTSPTNGWAVREHDIALDSMTDLPIQTLYRTRDGGTSWQRVDLPAPPLSFHDAPHGPAVELGLPKFFGSREGVMAASFNSSEAGGLFVYGTHDGGATWSISGPVPIHPGKGSPIFTPTFASPRAWAVASTSGELTATTNAGRSWSVRSVRSMKPYGFLAALAFTSGQDAWALACEGWSSGLATPATCDGRYALYRSADGGLSWALMLTNLPTGRG